MKFTFEMIKSYEAYKLKKPLDLEKCSNTQKIEKWKLSHQLSLLEFSRIVNFIINNSNINAFDNANFDFDMDNIYPIFHTLHEQQIIFFQGLSEYSIVPNNIQKKHSLIVENKLIDNPNYSYNQFPCTIESRKNRLDVIVSDHPFIESMNIGILGDDDLLSIEVQKVSFLNPVVFEIDQVVIDEIKNSSCEYINIKNIDLTDFEIKKDDIILDSFIVDPPYNLNGLLCFVFSGVKRLRSFNDFYLVVNKMMLGKHHLLKTQQILSQCGIILNKIIPGFNKYPFPKNYREYSDFQHSLNKINGKLDSVTPISSSSSLFVFNTSEINLHEVNNLHKEYSEIYQRYLG